MSHRLRTARGHPYPLGATVYPDGVLFCLFSRNATAVELLLLDRFDDAQPRYTISLDPNENRTFYYWHVFVFDLHPGQIYAYRVDGPYDPGKGQRFDHDKVLVDPYAREIIYGANWSRHQASIPGDNCATALKCVVADPNRYDWEEDRRPNVPFGETVIYEMHVGGFTRHPSSGVHCPGTYLGLIEKIPYLRLLGITAVELLPVQQFDEQDVQDNRAASSAGCTCRSNYWGYNPVGFFAPHRGYCTDPLNTSPVDEFRDMVKALHQAGIEVILDVVFNHTAEGDHNGPTISFRGIENRAYYLLEEEDRSRYSNYAGTGNTVNGNHSIVRRLILDALHYWVQEMHVDGFRFDLASVLARDEWGQPMRSPPILWDIESDPRLVGVKMIAEAWDAAGLYQVGTFIGHRWAEWNGRYRDDVRRFLRGDEGTVGSFSARIAGSPDIYASPDRALYRSINFVTAHDGFTLNDLVSYKTKHNLANGENNRDGLNENYSANYGHEGPTDDPEIEALRLRQIKNALTILLVSQGTPMLLFGDEVRRTQQGNNNAYCQNNETSWFNWNDVENNRGLLRFVQQMTRFNRRHRALNLDIFPDRVENKTETGMRSREATEHISYHGVRLGQPDWGHYSHSIAVHLRGDIESDDVYIAFNAYWEDLSFELPPHPSDKPWLRAVDTAQASPQDIAEPGLETPVTQPTYLVRARSVVILIGHRT